MKLLRDILGNKKDKVRLVSVVEKIENSPYGVFVNINNDLGHYIDKVGISDDPLRIMAYAYARRTAMACLYFQGMIERDAYEHVSLVFKGFQQTTGQTVEFQEEASAQADELIHSYADLSDVDDTLLTVILYLVEKGFDNSILGLEGRFLSIDGMIDIVNKMRQSHKLSEWIAYSQQLNG